MVGRFCPGNLITRAEFFQILLTAINATYHSSYTLSKTLDTNAYYHKAIMTAADWSILAGDDLDAIDADGDDVLENTDNELNQPLTRSEAARYIARAFDLYQGWTDHFVLDWKENPFPDLKSSHDDYYDILACFYSATSSSPSGVITGYGSDRSASCHAGDFCSDETILRGEMAKMIAKAIEYRLDSYMK